MSDLKTCEWTCVSENSSVERVPFVFDQSVYYFVQNLGVVIVKSCCCVLTTKAVLESKTYGIK